MKLRSANPSMTLAGAVVAVRMGRQAPAESPAHAVPGEALRPRAAPQLAPADCEASRTAWALKEQACALRTALRSSAVPADAAGKAQAIEAECVRLRAAAAAGKLQLPRHAARALQDAAADAWAVIHGLQTRKGARRGL
jgi:hypothetical protein